MQADRLATMEVLPGGGWGGATDRHRAQPPLAAERLERWKRRLGPVAPIMAAAHPLPHSRRSHGYRVSSPDPAGHHGGGD